ncbi:DUF5324 family protein [Streptomyces sp. NPDC014734]|uniref:DUF5324 family protein n=1 Tax=Streptomyces sp. NPDC014734 TaxID=3364886 RepID=UPI0036FDCC1E
MTRIDSVRAATDSAKDSVQHAADVVAPYADTARDQAAHLAYEARARLAPKVSKAAHQARVQYGAHVAPRIELARAHVPPKVDEAARRTAHHTRRAARTAADYTAPRVEHAMAVAQPVAVEASARGAAALAALRGQVTAKEIRQLARKHERRARAGRLCRGLLVAGAVAGAAYTAWRWWDRQANPDWLVEPSAATEVSERTPLSSVDGSGPASATSGTGAETPLSEEDGEGRGNKGPGGTNGPEGTGRG